MSKDKMWNELLLLGVSEQTIQFVVAINGYTEEVLKDILYVHTGYRSFKQL